MDQSIIQLARAQRSWLSDYLANRPMHAYDALCRRVRVASQSGTLLTEDVSNTLARSRAGNVAESPTSLTAPGAAPVLDDVAVSSGTYFCNKYRRGVAIPDENTKGSALPVSAVLVATRKCVRLLENDLDRMLMVGVAGVIANYTATTGIATLTAGGSGTSWASSASANSDPLGNLRAAADYIHKGTGDWPNRLVMAADVAQYLSDHSQLKGVLQYTDPGWIAGTGLPAHVRRLLPVPVDAMYDSAAPGAAAAVPKYAMVDATNSYSCAIVARVGEGDADPNSAFIWYDYPSPTTGQPGIGSRIYRDEEREATIVEAECYCDFSAGMLTAASKHAGAYMIASAIV